MPEKTKYYLDDDGGLWKTIGVQDYFFSRKKQEWITPKFIFKFPIWDYKNTITEDEANKILSDYKKEGIWEDEPVPMRYYANDNDNVFARDVYDNEYYVLADMSLKPASSGTIDIMWGGLSIGEAEELCKQQYQKDDWILINRGKELIRYIGDDYIGTIWLEEYYSEPGFSSLKKRYRSGIQLDDGIDYPYFVSYLEADTIEELKDKTEKEMLERNAFRNRPDPELDKWVEEMKKKMNETE